MAQNQSCALRAVAVNCHTHLTALNPMPKTLKINQPARSTDSPTRKPVRGRNRNNHVAPTPAAPDAFTKKPARSSDAPRGFSEQPKRAAPRRDSTDAPSSAYGSRDAHKPNRPTTQARRDVNDHTTRPNEKTARSPYGKPTSQAAHKPRRPSDDVPENPYGQAKPSQTRERSASPYAKTPNATGKNFQEPRRHGKLRDENGRVIKVVAPRLAPLDAGIRLSKHLSDQGLCSRREADDFIEKGWVTVNGQRATLGQRVLPSDKIQVARQAERAQNMRVTILINKPVGLVSGQAEDDYLPAVSLVTPENHWLGDSSDVLFEYKHLRGLAPAGRLDIDSVGLLVLTQDGRVAKSLIGDKSEVDKEYLVRVEGELSETNLALLNHGLELDGVPLRRAQVSWQNEDQLRFVLTEGKKRQIRRMCELVGLHVVGLKRIRIGRVVLGDLPTGQWRYLRADEQF